MFKKQKSISKELSNYEKKIIVVSGKYFKKTNKAIKSIKLEKSITNKLIDAFVPINLASKKILERQFSKYEEISQKLKIEIFYFDKNIEKNRASTLQNEKQLEKDLKNVKNEYNETCTNILVDKKRIFDEAEEKKIKNEKEYLAPQKNAIRLVKEFGFSEIEDLLPIIWEKIQKASKDKLEIIEKKYNLSKKWVDDLTANSDSITKFTMESLQVFFSTCVGFGSWKELTKFGNEAVDLVIIDESAHATIPETIIPLLYAKRAILIGDEKQLPPIVTSELSCRDNYNSKSQTEEISCHKKDFNEKDCWLEQSLFEYLWTGNYNIPKTMLDKQFRMHPDIADFVSQSFYENKLKTGVRCEDRKLTFSPFLKPLCLIPTSAYNERQEDFLNPGYRNILEAKIIKRVIEKAEKQLPKECSFGIITPYKHQVSTIHKELKPIYSNLEKVKLDYEDIASVDKFQGAERDVIIISFVRSPKECEKCNGTGKTKGTNCPKCKGKGYKGTGLTFVRDLKRLNVAFSRARYMLILIGDIDALTNNKYRGGKKGSAILNEFKKYISNYGRVLHVWEENYHE